MKTWTKYLLAGVFLAGLLTASQAQAAWPFDGATPAVANCITSPNTIVVTAYVPCYFDVYGTDPDNDDVQYLMHLDLDDINDFDENVALVATEGPDYTYDNDAKNDCVGGVVAGVDFVASGTHCAQQVTFTSQPQNNTWSYGFGVKDVTNVLTKVLRTYTITVNGAGAPPTLESLKIWDGSNYKDLVTGCNGGCLNGVDKTNGGAYWQDDQNNSGCGTSKNAPACRRYPVVKTLPRIDFVVSMPESEQPWLKKIVVNFDPIASCAQPWKCVYGYDAPTEDQLNKTTHRRTLQLNNSDNSFTKTFRIANGDHNDIEGDTITCNKSTHDGKKWWNCSYQMNQTTTYNHKWFNVRLRLEPNSGQNYAPGHSAWATNAHLKFAVDPVFPSNPDGNSP